jgi:hypothetical protein
MKVGLTKATPSSGHGLTTKFTGSFSWGGVNFSDSAEDINFSLEGDEGVPILRAALKNSEGESIHADINLSERIGNNDGSFVFGKCSSTGTG